MNDNPAYWPTVIFLAETDYTTQVESNYFLSEIAQNQQKRQSAQVGEISRKHKWLSSLIEFAVLAFQDRSKDEDISALRNS